jgi:hypothetical protein
LRFQDEAVQTAAITIKITLRQPTSFSRQRLLQRYAINDNYARTFSRLISHSCHWSADRPPAEGQPLRDEAFITHFIEIADATPLLVSIM